MLDIQVVPVTRAGLECHIRLCLSIKLDMCDNMRFVGGFHAVVVLGRRSAIEHKQ
jgi:hypothetical protein